MVDSDPALVILDVRTPSEYDSGHIRNAKLIPLAELAGRLSELNKADRILVYCKLGGRSSQASQILVDNGFLYVFNMLGGLAAWISEGYPIYVRYSSLQSAINGAEEGGILLVSSGTYHENIVVDKTVALVGESRNATIIDGDGTGSVVGIESNNVSLSGFVVRNGTRGFFSEACNGTAISNVKVTCNGAGTEGICLHDCWFAQICGNVLENSSQGIVLSNSYDNVVSNNVISARNGCGLHLTLSSNNTLDSNAVFGGIGADGNGVELEHSDQNVVVNNTVFDNGGIGLQLESSNNNLIYHNNMANNSLNAYDHNSSNIWDAGYPSGGNYWSDYVGTDENGDGIGDSPHMIDGNNTDDYPLMNLFMEGDINHDGEVSIFDVVKVCGAYGTRPPSPQWNVNADIAEPYGVIDIFDAVKVCRNYGKMRHYP
jgi:parallel beta-helix repeat protein